MKGFDATPLGSKRTNGAPGFRLSRGSTTVGNTSHSTLISFSASSQISGVTATTTAPISSFSVSDSSMSRGSRVPFMFLISGSSQVTISTTPSSAFALLISMLFIFTRPWGFLRNLAWSMSGTTKSLPNLALPVAMVYDSLPGTFALTDSLEFRSLSIAAINVCHIVASRSKLLPLVMTGIVLPNAKFRVEMPLNIFMAQMANCQSTMGSVSIRRANFCFPMPDFANPNDWRKSSTA